MIAGLSKAVTLYLSPLLGLTAVLLSLFSFLAPVLILQDRVALLTVTPSTSLIQTGPSDGVDGPSLFLGPLGKQRRLARQATVTNNDSLLGSCARVNNAASINCTAPTFSPIYGMILIFRGQDIFGIIFVIQTLQHSQKVHPTSFCRRLHRPLLRSWLWHCCSPSYSSLPSA